MYATIKAVISDNGVLRVVENPWSVAAQSFAEANAVDGQIEFSAGTFPATKSEKLELLLSQLSETDYLAIKYAEGQTTEREYAPMRLQRQEWRNEYNALEGDDTNE